MDTPLRRLTIAEFMWDYRSFEGKIELVEGFARAVQPGHVRHAWVNGNLQTALGRTLKGSGWLVLGGDMGLQTGPSTVRYPDCAVYGDRRDVDPDNRDATALQYPTLVVEVTTDETRDYDRGIKCAEYLALASLRAFWVVDPVAMQIEVHERCEKRGWQHRLLPRDAPLVLRKPPASVDQAVIFDDD